MFSPCIIISMAAVGSSDLQSPPHPFNTPLVGDLNFNGPVLPRKCTDWPWVFLFLAANLGLLAQSGYGLAHGEPGRLLHGWDFRGELCGSGDLSAKAYTYFPIPELTMEVALCLEGCPVLATQHSVCYYDTNHVTDVTALPCYASYTSKPFFTRYCLPAQSAAREVVLDWLYRRQQVSTRVVGDLVRGWDIVAVADLVVIAILMMLLLGLFVGKCILTQAGAVVLALVALMGVLCYVIYEESWRIEGRVCDTENSVPMEDCDSSHISSAYQSFSYLCIVLFALILLYLVARSQRMLTCSSTLSLSTQPIHYSPSLICMLILCVIIGSALVLFTLVVITYLASTASVETIETVIPGWQAKQIEFTGSARGSVLYAGLLLLWWLSVLVTALEYVTCYYTCIWFFSKDKSRMNQPVCMALWTLFRYHLGSVLLGALAVPVLKTPRSCFQLLHFLLTRLSNTASFRHRKVLKASLWLHDHFLTFLHSHTLPFQALWGTPYLESSKRGYFLLARTPARVLGSIQSVETFLWPYQLVVTLTGPLLAYAWVLHASWTPFGEATLHITSATALAGVSLLFSLFAAEALGGFMRGLMYAEGVSYAADREMFSGVQRFAEISFSLAFQEELNLETSKVDADYSLPSEESHQDLLEAAYMTKQAQPVSDTLSSQVSLFSDTSDEARPQTKRPTTPLPALDTARNLDRPCLPGQVERRGAEVLTPEESFSSLEEEEVPRNAPEARPPSRREAQSRKLA